MEKNLEKYRDDLKIIGRKQQQELIISDYHCIIKRDRLNVLSGYILLDSNIEIELEVLKKIKVHGGITYMGYKTIDNKKNLIIGFDKPIVMKYVEY